MNEKFEDVLDKLLKGEWSGSVIRKVHRQEKKIRGEKNVPHFNLEGVARRKLEEIFKSGRVNPKYAREVLTALEYSQRVYHYRTGASLLDDIETNQRIVFNNYR